MGRAWGGRGLGGRHSEAADGVERAEGAQIEQGVGHGSAVGVDVHGAGGRQDAADADLDAVLVERIAGAVAVRDARAVPLVQMAVVGPRDKKSQW